MSTQVIMPQLGESVVEGTVARWLVAEGQPVKQYDPLMAVSTDKVDTEISAPASGILLKIYVPEGQTVERGTVLALIGATGEAAPAEQPPAAPGGPHGGEPQPAPQAGPSGSAAQIGASARTEAADAMPSRAEPAPVGEPPAVTPLAQRVAQEHGIDLTAVTGTGPGGRIIKEDVEARLAEQAAAGDGEPGGGQSPAGRTPDAAGLAQEERTPGFISPAVARLAAEYRIDLGRVAGTGEGGRVTKKDVLAFIATRQAQPPAAAGQAVDVPAWEQPGTGSLFKPTEEMAAEQSGTVQRPQAAPGGPLSAPAVPGRPVAAPSEPAVVPAPPAGRLPAAGADDELRPLSTMRRSIAKHMVHSKSVAPQVTTVMEADMTRVVQARERLKGEYERQGVKLTYTPFFVLAIIAGLKAVPEANSSFQDDSLLLHRRIHMGMAVAVAGGLIVPVIRDADEKSLLGLARAVNDLAERARQGRLAPEDVQGSTFTLTNHGTAGSLLATPIINQPQAGILGVGAVQKRPVVISHGSSLLPGPDDFIAIRPMAYLSFTFDHRVLDGAGADGFLAAVKDYLEAYGAGPS